MFVPGRTLLYFSFFMLDLTLAGPVQAPHTLLQPLWVHMCVSASVLFGVEDTIPWCHPFSLTLPKSMPCFLYSKALWAMKGKLIQISQLGHNSAEPLILYMVHHRRSLCWFPSASWESFSDDGRVRDWSMGTAGARNSVFQCPNPDWVI